MDIDDVCVIPDASDNRPILDAREPEYWPIRDTVGIDRVTGCGTSTG